MSTAPVPGGKPGKNSRNRTRTAENKSRLRSESGPQQQQLHLALALPQQLKQHTKPAKNKVPIPRYIEGFFFSPQHLNFVLVLAWEVCPAGTCAGGVTGQRTLMGPPLPSPRVPAPRVPPPRSGAAAAAVPQPPRSQPRALPRCRAYLTAWPRRRSLTRSRGRKKNEPKKSPATLRWRRAVEMVKKKRKKNQKTRLMVRAAPRK